MKRTEEDYYVYKFKNGKTLEGIISSDRDKAIEFKEGYTCKDDLIVCHVEKYQYFDDNGNFVKEEIIIQSDEDK